MNQFIAPTALAACAAFAHAGPGLTFFDNRTDFDANTGAQQIEDFEAESLGLFSMPTIFNSGLAGDLVNGSVSSMIEAGDPDNFGFENSTDGGRKYLRLGRSIPGGTDETGSFTVSFGFGGAVRAFGFDLSGFQPQFAAGGFNLSLFNGGQLVEDIFVPSDQPNSEVRFYGFLSAADFDSASVNIPVLGSNQSADFVAFDGVTWAVPAPAPLSMLALGGLVATRRRR